MYLQTEITTRRRWVLHLGGLWLLCQAVLLSAQESSELNFSFDQVDVRSFVKLVSEITGRQFVIHEQVTGRITVMAPRIAQEDVYPFFVAILESVGASVMEEGGLHRVVPLADGAAPVAPVIGPGEATPAQGVVTKLIRLEHLNAESLQKAMTAQLSRGAKATAIAATEESNHLLITDTAENVRRMEAIVSQLDQPGMARMTEVVPLQFAGAEELASQLNDAMSESETRGERLRRRLPASGSPSLQNSAGVVPAAHANALILVGTANQIAQMRRLIEKMDVDAPAGRSRLNAIFLQYLGAEEAAASLNGLLEKSASGREGAAGVGRRISIEPNVANNALLVDASPSDFEVVNRLIQQLDQMPQQVLIEVLIAEWTVSDRFSFGVDMGYVDLPADGGDGAFGGSTLGDQHVLNQLQSGVFPGGIALGVIHGSGTDGDGNRLFGYPGVINIDAVKQNSNLRILSETSLEAQNNREATVSIVNEIPILTSTIEGGSGTARDVIQNIERVDVGIQLKLTPHVVANDQVQMILNPTIETVIDEGPSGTFAPTISKRQVSTTVTVPDGETIVIAGLTREDTNRVVRRVPLLGSIPLVGWLFRHTVDQTEKTNVLIFVTPHIVRDRAGARAMMQRWRDKTGIYDGVVDKENDAL